MCACVYACVYMVFWIMSYVYIDRVGGGGRKRVGEREGEGASSHFSCTGESTRCVLGYALPLCSFAFHAPE